MIDAGLFSDARIELVEGELVEMAPSGRAHGELVARLTRIVGNAYGDKDWVHFVDTYVGIGQQTVRAPDIFVVDRLQDDGNELTGKDVVLAIEVSHATLREDLGRKRIDYATAGVRNYWVVDVEGGRVHRYSVPTGFDYARASIDGFDEALALPESDQAIVIG